MRLKEFVLSDAFKNANCVVYRDNNGEIEPPTTEVLRRRMRNREVIGYSSHKEGELIYLDVVLK